MEVLSDALASNAMDDDMASSAEIAPATEADDGIDGTVTRAMVEEEAKMEEAHRKEQAQRLKEEANNDFNQHIMEQRRARLNFLITQAGVYSKWLASRLETRQKEQQEGKRVVLASQPPTQAANHVESAGTSAQSDKKPEQAGAKGKKVVRRSSGRGKPADDNDANDNEENEQEEDSEMITRSGMKRKSGGDAAASNNKKSKKATAKSNALLDLAAAEGPGAPPSQNGNKDPAEVKSHRQPSLITGATMREYQIVGMEWLISLWEQGLNGILADEMGLGKTLQTIAFLAHLTEMKVWGPFLIVAPLSTLSNWISEIQRFAPSLNCLLYHGLTTERAELRKTRMSVLNSSFPIIVTSYEIVMNDRRYLQKYNWKYIIIDEGHRLKNLNCRLMRELKTYRSANRLILSGTPLQNNLAELWSLLNFLMPDIFESLEDFEGWFDFQDLKDSENEKKILDKEATESIVTNLHALLKPFLLRRIKTEVALELPKKRELLVFAPLVPRQKELYDACVRGVNGLRTHLAKVLDDRRGIATLESSTSVVEGGDQLSGGSHKMINKKNAAAGDANGEGGAKLTDAEGSEMEVSEKNLAVENSVPDGDIESKKERRRSSRNALKDVSYEQISDDRYFEMLDEKQQTGTAKNTVKAPKQVIEQTSTRIINNQNLQNLIVQLRKICNHPYLFNSPGQELTDELDARVDASDQESKVTVDGDVAVRLPDIVASSGKMLMLERLLPRLLDRKHKVLIFSQMTKMLDIIGDWLEFVKKLKFSRIDGNVAIDERKQQINEFNTSPDVNIFLLSTRAGGLGINLTAADTVIIYDSDWNPQVDLQAQDRVHRIGQTKPVIIYRLVTSGTVEKKILDKANSKRKLEKLVIHKSEFKGRSDYYKNNSRVTDLAELASILEADETETVMVSSDEAAKIDGKPGTAMVFMNKVISDEQLEKILDRSPEAFEKKSQNGATVAGNNPPKTVKNGIAMETDARAVFEEVEEQRDESNDLLAKM